MATHKGSEGVVKVGANTVAAVRSYSIEETGDTVEDSVIGTVARTYKPTLTSWTASMDIYWDESDTTGQGALTIGAEVTVGLYPEGDTTGDVYYTGSAIVTGSSISGSFDGMVEGSISLQGNGALTIGPVV
jgi:hypothetical protein